MHVQHVSSTDTDVTSYATVTWLKPLRQAKRCCPRQCIYQFCTGSGAACSRPFVGAIRATLRNSSVPMAALLDALRWPHFIAEEVSTQMGTGGKAGIPRFNGEPTRLAEYTFRAQAKQLWPMMNGRSSGPWD